MTYAEAVERLRAMGDDDGGTWDLSPKDRAAIDCVLDRIDRAVVALRKAVDVIEFLERHAPGYAGGEDVPFIRATARMNEEAKPVVPFGPRPSLVVPPERRWIKMGPKEGESND